MRTLERLTRWRCRRTRARRGPVDVARRLNDDDVIVPLLYTERPMSRHCWHLLVDCSVDASSWCDRTGCGAIHPGRRCLFCDGVIDLVRVFPGGAQ